MGERNSSILLIHDDPDVLDSLTGVLEGAGFDVAIAATAFAATNQLEEQTGDGFVAVIAAWGSGARSGLRVYCWILENLAAMRTRFVFLAEDEPVGFRSLVKDSCPLLHPQAHKKILDAVVKLSGVTPLVARDLALPTGFGKKKMPVKTSVEPEEVDLDAEEDFSLVFSEPAEAASIDGVRPTLLLVEDEPLMLRFMRKQFVDVGFSVTAAEGGKEAIALMGEGEFDVVLADWYMPEGSGEDIYEWVQSKRPDLLPRCIFMSGAVGVQAHADIAPQGCQVFPKGQDPEKLIEALKQAAERSRTATS